MSHPGIEDFKKALEAHKKVVKLIPFHREISKNPEKLREYEDRLICRNIQHSNRTLLN